MGNPEDFLLEVYHRLFACYGPQHWWPAQSPFEVIVGAILTQQTSWNNVEKAISNLKRDEVLTPTALRHLPLGDLAQSIYPAGYYNSKALKIKSFVGFLGEHYNDSLDELFTQDIPSLRAELLSAHGIGQETADSIILYAARKPIFVIDAYTRRIAHRLSFEPSNNSYAAFQLLFMQHLPHDEKLFNEYHALFVCHGKKVCRRLPLCERCCLRDFCSLYLLRS
jgi:endonuclease-3 related protein